MPHPILELQKDCIDYFGDATNILRKAYAYSRKLQLTDFSNWLDLEMKGYEKPDSVPEYRRVRGVLQALSYRGLIPVQFPSDILDSLTTTGITQSISELSTIVRKMKTELCTCYSKEM